MADNLDNVRARVGAALKHWRSHRELTQEALAEQSGLTNKFIGEIERGVGNPTIETLDKLASALGIELSDLVAADHQPAEFRLSRKQVQRVREAAESIDNVMRQLAGAPARRRRRSLQKTKSSGDS